VGYDTVDTDEDIVTTVIGDHPYERISARQDGGELPTWHTVFPEPTFSPNLFVTRFTAILPDDLSSADRNSLKLQVDKTLTSNVVLSSENGFSATLGEPTQASGVWVVSAIDSDLPKPDDLRVKVDLTCR
jgi:hypothetical protein